MYRLWPVTALVGRVGCRGKGKGLPKSLQAQPPPSASRCQLLFEDALQLKDEERPSRIELIELQLCWYGRRVVRCVVVPTYLLIIKFRDVELTNIVIVVVAVRGAGNHALKYVL